MRSRLTSLLFILLLSGTGHAQVSAFNGRTGSVTLGSGDVTSALGYTPANKAGDTLTGTLNFGTLTSPTLLNAYSTSGGTIAASGDNVTTFQNQGARFSFLRQVQSGSPTNPGLYGELNLSPGTSYTAYGWGGYPSVPNAQFASTSHPGSNGTIIGVYSVLNSQGNNPFASQDQAISANVVKIGQNSTWAIATQSEDHTGQPPQSFASVGAEIDIVANGSDTPNSLFDPSQSARFLLLLGPKDYRAAKDWSAGETVSVGQQVVATPAGGVPTIYIVMNTGTAGNQTCSSGPPTWQTSPPTSGPGGAYPWPTGSQALPNFAPGDLVDDCNGVQYGYGTPFALTQGTGIWLGTGTAETHNGATTRTTYNTGIASSAYFNNAILDFSAATLTRSDSAARARCNGASAPGG
jgi:hypothetical protein